MKKNSIKQITIAAVMIAIGVILPMYSHVIAAGPVLLPMHIPVLIAGFLLLPQYAVIVGILTPILSSVLTGMPPTFPMLPIMIFELATYALVASILFNKLKFNVYVVLIISMIIGRIVGGITAQILIMGFDAKFESGWVFVVNGVTTGLMGIAIQLVIIPPIVIALRKAMK